MKELGHISPVNKTTKDTDTIEFMILDEIVNILKGNTIATTGHKIDYHRVRIAAGGDLINYSFELATCICG